MIRPAALLLAAILAGCGQRPAAHPQRYAGRLDGCGDLPASLVRVGDSISFAPGDGVLVIRGAVGPDGGFAGVLNTQPPGKPEFLLRLHGRFDGARAVLDYATPRCAARATLTLAE